MSRARCPSPADLERLFRGGLLEQTAEALDSHILDCRSCLEQLEKLGRDNDSLAGLIRGDTRVDSVVSGPVIDNLMEKLKSLRKPSPGVSRQGAPMITFVCSGCQKQLSAKEELAGKKVKCRACGQATLIPGQVAAGPVGREDMKTLPPAPERKTLSPTDAGNRPTHPPSQASEVTRGAGAPDLDESDHESSFTDFLAPPQTDDELGRLGAYRILKVLGHGGMGVVYKAEDPRLERTVAIKAMLPGQAASASAGKRFLREARAMAKVKHDHIVTIYQVDEERGVPFLAMEFLAGEPLDERLKREEKLPLPEILRIGREIAKGLDAAHTSGLIHRDIKPANIWLEAPNGRVKILDFGLARAASQEAGLTQQGAIIGTPSYMAPEQAQGNPVDARGDLFSLGVVLYRLSSGELPFKGTDTVSTLMAVVMNHPEPPSQLNGDLPQEFSDLVMRLLEKDPAKRIASASEVMKALEHMEKKPARKQEVKNEFADLTAELPKPTAPRTGGRGSRRAEPASAQGGKRWGLIIGLLVLLGGLAVGGGTLALVLFRTPEGDYVIDTDDPDFAFQVAKGGGVTLEDRKTKRKYVLKVVRQKDGEYVLEMAEPASGLTFHSKTITIKRGDKPVLSAWFTRKKDEAVAGAGDEAKYLERVAAMKDPEDQVAAVMARMKEVNKGFDGKETHVCGKAGVVTELQFVTDKVTDLRPLKALPGLQTLTCAGSFGVFGRLADLSPLSGMKLATLRCWNNKVFDLSPLKGMPLTTLDCTHNLVADLSPLKGMSLTTLILRATAVRDLSPLKGLPLTTLTCDNTKVSDLSPLAGMKLTSLDFHQTAVSDLMPLKGMPLRKLICNETQIKDLSPLKKMDLERLECANTHVADLTPLKGMKLAGLRCDGTRVMDLSPLKGMPLTGLQCDRTGVTDLSPLKELPVNWLVCDYKPERDRDILSSIGTLGTINHRPAKEVLAARGKATPVDEAWVKKVAAMPPVKQVEAVMAKMKGLNPGFDGKEEHVCGKIGVVTELAFNTGPVADITPLRALAGLQKLTIHGTVGAGKLTDLSPLKGLKLTYLGCAWHPALGDLSPLKDMPLTTLSFPGSAVSDLTPLKGMKLEVLHLGGTRVTNLAPLKGMPLTQLTVASTLVSDLTPLAGMKQLTLLNCNRARVADLAPLKGLNLKHLDLEFAPVTDLKPLEGMKLTFLNCAGTRVADLAPLEGMKLIHLDCVGTKVASLTPLKGMPLTYLACHGTLVSDLTPLKKMPLTVLWVNTTRVADLKPLIGMPLEVLGCAGAKVTDLTPLKDMPLKRLYCDYKPDRDREILSSIKTLETINDKPAKEFLGAGGKATPVDEAWLKKVAAMPPAQQVKAVMAKMKDLNPGFDGEETHVVGKPGVVTELTFSTAKVMDISPVRALAGLQSLTCNGTDGNERLANLSPLKGMKLTALSCCRTKVSDLTPLAGMKLTSLACGWSKVSDLSPLKGMPLTKLELTVSLVADLAPLEGMKLTWLRFAYTKVSDLSPLKGMPLTHMDCGITQVSDLSPLKGMKLESLHCWNTRVSDLSPLKGMPLVVLRAGENKVADLSPLKGTPLKVLQCDFVKERDAAVLRSIKTLVEVNGKPAKEVLK